jgi:carbonic anhydrase
LTKQQRDALSVVQIIDELKKGNERFRTGRLVSHDYRDQQRTTATGQFPAAVVVGCIDSRAPAEIIFDVGIGDTFYVRIAGYHTTSQGQERTHRTSSLRTCGGLISVLGILAPLAVIFRH